MFSLVFRMFEFLFYHLLISFVDCVSRLPRNSTPPGVMRLYRENIALKAQNGALLLELNAAKGKRAKMPLRVRAAQVFSYLLTRGNREFQEYCLAASRKTIKRWAVRLRRGPWRKVKRVGRPPLDAAIVAIILELKKSSPGWGARRI